MLSSSTDEVTPGGDSEFGQTAMGRSGRNETTSHDPPSSSQSGKSSSNRGPSLTRIAAGDFTASQITSC